MVKGMQKGYHNIHKHHNRADNIVTPAEKVIGRAGFHNFRQASALLHPQSAFLFHTILRDPKNLVIL